MNLARLDDLNYRWPIVRLQNLTHFPLRQQTSLGDTATLFSNDSLRDTFSPNNRFVGMFALAVDRLIRQSDGEVVLFYQLVPLYWEEPMLARNEGIPALMKSLRSVLVEATPYRLVPYRRNVKPVGEASAEPCKVKRLTHRRSTGAAPSEFRRRQ